MIQQVKVRSVIHRRYFDLEIPLELIKYLPPQKINMVNTQQV